MTKEKRSNKWAFLLYQESAPDNYLDILEDMHIPFVLSPWHDKDVNKETGEFKKAHKHGALYFDSLKSYSQVSELVTTHLNTPAHVEVIMSPKGMYDYFTHAENPEKTLYDINDIEIEVTRYDDIIYVSDLNDGISFEITTDDDHIIDYVLR